MSGTASGPAPHILGGVDLSDLAQYVLQNDIRKILVLVGAGASVGAGIPDFRSPGSGLYDNLGKYNLDDPADAFSMDLLRANPSIFYQIAQEMNLWPGAFKPTPAHYFIKLLENEGRLLRCCTQNIDGLERQAGVSSEKLVEAHGSFNSASCIECKQPFDIELNRELAFSGVIPRCPQCGGIVKPDVVFFGEQLPERFFEVFDGDTERAELLIIIGTSLQVHPFASLPLRVRPDIPRALFNMVRAGGAMFRFPQDLSADSSSPRSSSSSSSSAAAMDAEEASSTSAPGSGAEEGAEERDKKSEELSDSSSEGYAQYVGYGHHLGTCRDIFFPGDCQESLQRFVRLLGLQNEFAELVNAGS